MVPQPIVYTRTARVLHWVTVLLLLALIGLGVTMTRWVPDERKIQVYSWHEWVGITIFVLTLIRLVWTVLHPVPPPPGLNTLERTARRTVHAGIYVVLLVQPIIGWIMSCAFGFPVVYLGILPLPLIVEENRELAARMQGIHDALALTLVGLVALHVGAVLYHHLIRQDGVLHRMLPSAARKVEVRR